jgi:glutamyl-tRNA reductase
VVDTAATRTRSSLSAVLTRVYSHPRAGLACTYVDSTVRDVQWIGSAYERLTGAGQDVPVRNGFLLRTCERVEVYCSLGSSASRSAHPFGEVAAVLEEPLAVCRRLAEIAAGVSSRLLGERFIAGQVARAGLAVPAKHPLGELVADAVRLARHVRHEHGFAALVDYPDLVERLLHNAGRATVKSLVVVGSGVLARSAMAHRFARRYQRILPVTRSVKRLRKRLPTAGADLRVCSPEGVWGELDESGWDVVVATTNLVEPYRTQITELIADRRCRVAVDVSCVPLWTKPLDSRYHNLYGSMLSALIAEQNSAVAGRAEQVRAAIASACAECSR